MNEVWAADEVWAVDRTWPPNSSDISLEHYLLMKRGPKHLPLTVVVPITLIYAAIFFSGVVGNIATCLVIVTNRSLHNATNYYLFSLAVSDTTLLLLGLPNDLSVFWQQYPWRLGQALCKLRALVSEMTSYSSVLTIVAFSMERYLAICHPLVSYTMAGLRRASCIVSFLWALSFCSALPFSIYTKVNYISYPPDSDIQLEESAFCGMLEENIPKHFPIYELSFIVFFFLPLCIILLLYCLIGLQIRSKPIIKNFQGTIHKKSKKSQSRKSIIRMLVAVVVTFFVCWAPYHAQRLYYFYGRGSEYYYIVNEWLYYVAGCFYYLSATANPILYNLMSVKYRNGFRRTFCGRRVSSRPNTVVRQRSTTHQASLPEDNQDPLIGKSDVEEDPLWKKAMVQIDPDKKCTTVTTETLNWARLRVTIDHPRHNPPETITVHMETV